MSENDNSTYQVDMGPSSRKQRLMLESGANITVIGGAAGCVDAKTEFLSPEGWKPISEWKEGDKVAQYDLDDGLVEFVTPLEYINKKTEGFYKVVCGGKTQYLSEEHTVLYKQKGFLYRASAKGLFKHQQEEVSLPFIYNTNTFIVSPEWEPLESVEWLERNTRKYCFTVPSGYLVLKRQGNIFITGNSGKSYMMTMYPLQFIDDPNYDAIFFRRTTTQISGQGGLFDTAREMYGHLPEPLKPRLREKDYKAIFPSGATIKWSHMEHEASRFNHQGLQYSLVGFDEATHFTWSQIEYLMGRLRSGAKSPSRMIMSCNPDPDCDWLLRLVKWYLDEEGYPNPEKDGVVRWFIRMDGEFLWGDSKEDILAKYGRTDAEGNLLPEDHRLQVKPLSFTFVSATIYDNPPVLEQNPEYLAYLEGLNEVDKARLLHGNWYIRPQGDNYFERDWLGSIHSEDLPPRRRQVRAWDKASEEPNQVNKYPDYTASVKMSKCKQGFYYIEGASRFQKRPGDRDKEILNTASDDGNDCYIVSAIDPGSSGKFEFQEFAKFLMEEGFLLKKDPMPSNKNKLRRFEPFAISAQNGLVYVVEDSFDPEEIEQFYKELESFTGERSTSARKDDWVDSCASAFNYLTKERVLPEFTLPGSGSNDAITTLKKDVSTGQ